jgi:hypothetical protein
MHTAHSKYHQKSKGENNVEKRARVIVKRIGHYS